MVVYVVLHDNYGDQGVDFHGVFSTKELADEYITSQMIAREQEIIDAAKWFLERTGREREESESDRQRHLESERSCWQCKPVEVV